MERQPSMNKGLKSKKATYTVEVKYSKEASEKKLIRFTPKGKNFEISADELINLLTTQVNNDVLSPTFVDIDRINVVEVSRQLKCVLDEDMKKGQEIRLNYTHPYPIEFALIEEAYKIAKINKDVPALELTMKYMNSVKKRTTPSMVDYIKKFYRSFKGLSL